MLLRRTVCLNEISKHVFSCNFLAWIHLFDKSLFLLTLLNFQPKSVLKNRKSEFDILEDDDTPHYESAEDTSQPSHIDLVIDSMNVGLSFA